MANFRSPERLSQKGLSKTSVRRTLALTVPVAWAKCLVHLSRCLINTRSARKLPSKCRRFEPLMSSFSVVPNVDLCSNRLHRIADIYFNRKDIPLCDSYCSRVAAKSQHIPSKTAEHFLFVYRFGHVCAKNMKTLCSAPFLPPAAAVKESGSFFHISFKSSCRRRIMCYN